MSEWVVGYTAGRMRKTIESGLDNLVAQVDAKGDELEAISAYWLGIKVLEVCHGLLASCLSVERHSERHFLAYALELELALHRFTPIRLRAATSDLLWKGNPGVSLGHEVGSNCLDVIQGIGSRVLSNVYVGRNCSGFTMSSTREFPYGWADLYESTSSDPRVNRWFVEFKKSIRKNGMFGSHGFPTMASLTYAFDVFKRRYDDDYTESLMLLWAKEIGTSGVVLTEQRKHEFLKMIRVKDEAKYLAGWIKNTESSVKDAKHGIKSARKVIGQLNAGESPGPWTLEVAEFNLREATSSLERMPEQRDGINVAIKGFLKKATEVLGPMAVGDLPILKSANPAASRSAKAATAELNTLASRVKQVFAKQYRKAAGRKSHDVRKGGRPQSYDFDVTREVRLDYETTRGVGGKLSYAEFVKARKQHLDGDHDTPSKLARAFKALSERQKYQKR
jgi:hypothetical protein